MLNDLIGLRIPDTETFTELYQPFLLSSHRLGVTDHFDGQQLVTQCHNHPGQAGIFARGASHRTPKVPRCSNQHALLTENLDLGEIIQTFNGRLAKLAKPTVDIRQRAAAATTNKYLAVFAETVIKNPELRSRQLSPLGRHHSDKRTSTFISHRQFALLGDNHLLGFAA